MRSAKILGQVFAYAAFGAVLVLASHGPAYHPLAQGGALVLVSVAHPSRPDGACRRLSEAELAARAPNMRAPVECPRRRVPVRVTMDIDGRTVVDETALPSGIAHDGSASLYRRIPVEAGRHHVRVRMDDEERSAGIILSAGQVLRIEYRPAQGGIVIL